MGTRTSERHGPEVSRPVPSPAASATASNTASSNHLGRACVCETGFLFTRPRPWRLVLAAPAATQWTHRPVSSQAPSQPTRCGSSPTLRHRLRSCSSAMRWIPVLRPGRGGPRLAGVSPGRPFRRGSRGVRRCSCTAPLRRRGRGLGRPARLPSRLQLRLSRRHSCQVHHSFRARPAAPSPRDECVAGRRSTRRVSRPEAGSTNSRTTSAPVRARAGQWSRVKRSPGTYGRKGGELVAGTCA